VTGCLSNTNAPHWEELAHSHRFPAIRAMHHRLASFEIDASKPDPRAFKAFETATGCSGSEILLFDDSQANCDAAVWLGWQALRVDPHGNPAEQMRTELRRVGAL
jgi:HAD superfamily hydrolase (TIGR01509 family)